MTKHANKNATKACREAGMRERYKALSPGAN